MLCLPVARAAAVFVGDTCPESQCINCKCSDSNTYPALTSPACACPPGTCWDPPTCQPVGPNYCNFDKYGTCGASQNYECYRCGYAAKGVTGCNTDKKEICKDIGGGNYRCGCPEGALNDLNNCGSCGTLCAPANAADPSCTDGTCTFTTCEPDYADCDGDPANGCEVNTQQDAANCGGCSRLDPTRACSLPNAVAKCVSGSCAIDSCSPGWADCDDDAANGCETQLNTVANCGGCSNLDSKFACSSANGTPTCTGGQCTIACASGFADCDGDPATGCEVNTQQDVLHCGGCGPQYACSTTNGTPTCTGGVCSIACAPGFENCDNDPANGCEAQMNTATSCGGCGKPCAPANAADATCQSGTCTFTTCVSGYANCDGSAANGCEVEVATSNAHCGRCGNPCPAGTQCQGGSCQCSAVAGSGATSSAMLCDGACVDTASNAKHCGGCGKKCPKNVTCQGGSCSCPAGTNLCDEGCVNTKADPKHCGGCGKKCPKDVPCQDGSCGCIAGTSLCDGGCVDMKKDPKHCGGCGKRVAKGGTCQNGVSMCSAGKQACNEECTDVSSDDKNCGACGTKCKGNTSCRGGQCVDRRQPGRSEDDAKTSATAVQGAQLATAAVAPTDSADPASTAGVGGGHTVAAPESVAGTVSPAGTGAVVFDAPAAGATSP
ncbi:hypothetical protein COHA_008554 [Chlorella ohadii]|uniref:Protein CPL1-like domain-containing protein n=1 Tax=Chlorella ohadii TaxID=2649997 RepID=A0AAD5DL76_9CHLO|nr:hypothetical protein COHA_008554 [Chlorella ohadii]